MTALQSSRDLLPGGAYDRYLARLAAEDKFSGTVLLAHRGVPVLSRAYGMADRERSVRNGMDTIYALASASKPFTGLAIVQLAQQGKLQFYEKLGSYLDGYPAEVANTVTVHHLLTHTCGLGDPTRNPWPDKITYSVEEHWEILRAFLRKDLPTFTPGTQSAYSSSGYEILGEIVAAVSGQSFWDYVREHIFAPAGMTRSDFYTRPQWLADERIAHPYWLRPSGERVDAVRNLDAGAGEPGTAGLNSARAFIGTGAGNGFSTAGDLLRFARALLGHKLLNPAYTELFLGAKTTTPPMGEPDPARHQSAMAYGPTAGIFNNQRVVGHGGGIAGGSTSWSLYLDLDWTAVMLCNYDLDLQSITSREKHAVTDGAS
ncbi:serine hydrolase domain-containing protein [Amycolatopsis nigrescens]|uniref:serine hydrolase domain-containing protein n=1 Tax=Amycolatopsis nigrescens TaxID=381445 RepID=UPI000382CE91|nr:serine hydrolase domain-containing protein [Amycolatopsis nigrescens]